MIIFYYYFFEQMNQVIVFPVETKIGLTDCSRASRWLSSPSHNSDSIWILLTILWILSSLDEIRETKKITI